MVTLYRVGKRTPREREDGQRHVYLFTGTKSSEGKDLLQTLVQKAGGGLFATEVSQLVKKIHSSQEDYKRHQRMTVQRRS